MALRSGHGNGSGVPRIEVLPADELPAGVPGHARAVSPSDRGDRGQFARGRALDQVVQITPPRVIAENARRIITASLVLDREFPKFWIEHRSRTRDGKSARTLFVAIPLSRLRALSRVINEALEAGARHASALEEIDTTCRAIDVRCEHPER